MTVFNFAPSAQAPFIFQPTLDGQVYTVTVTWNLFAQRYYVNIITLDGTVVVSLPLIGSGLGVATTTINWSRETVMVETAGHHGFPFGRTINLTLSDITPAAYNGRVSAFITGPSTLTYPLTPFPGPTTAMGTVSYDVSLTAGYFNSTLVYRAVRQQFEVSP